MTNPATMRGFASFLYRDFTLLIIAKLFGWIALNMVLMAIAYQVYDRTGDVLNLAYIGLATFTPAIGFALFTGYLADLYDRRWVLVICYLIVGLSAFMFIVYTLVKITPVWPVFAILLLLGAGRAFHQPAINSLVPTLVPNDIVPNAIAWHTTVNKITQVTGPALGGLVYMAGAEYVYFSATLALAIAALTTLAIRTRTNRGVRKPTTLSALLAGIRYVYNKKIIFGAITLDLLVVLLGGVTALFPVFAKDILEVGAAGAGFLRSAMAGGALLSGLILTQTGIQHGVGKKLFGTVLMFGAATIVFGLSELFWLSFFAMTALGAADMVSVNIRVTLIQIATPDAMRGRVSAVSSVFTGASNEIGEFRAAVMAALIGTVPAVVIGGVGSIVVAAVCWKGFPALTQVDRFDQDF